MTPSFWHLQVMLVNNVCLEGDILSGFTRHFTTQYDSAEDFLRRNKNQFHHKIVAHIKHTISRTSDSMIRQVQVKLVISVGLKGDKVPGLI